MDNKQIYKATLCFSIRRVLWDLLALLVWAGVMALGFFIAEKAADKGLIGLAIGGVIGLIALVFFLRWLSYKYKAGQIAMMTKGITEGELPQDVMGEGQKIVKERFATVAAFVSVRICAGVLPIMAKFFRMIFDAIMNRAAGTPLPETSAMTMHR